LRAAVLNGYFIVEGLKQQRLRAHDVGGSSFVATSVTGGPYSCLAF
jgi:hypothetical protein